MKTAANKWLLSVILCVIVVGQASASGQKVSFPGTKSETKSPDGRYVVKNFDDEKQDPAHRLAVIDTKNGVATKLYTYGRHVDVLWSPSSNAFVVNDYEGSSEAHPALFRTPWTGQSVDLRKELLKFLRSRGGTRSVLDNHHVYLSAERWLSGDEILCRLTAYGEADPKGVSKDYIYKVGEGFRTSK